MTLSYPNQNFAAAPDRSGADLWSLVDVVLLIFVFAVSSDMLVQLGPVQSLVWMMCYALTLLRIMMTFPHFLAMLSRNKVLLFYPMACLASVLWSYSRGESLTAGIQLTMTLAIAAYLGWRYSLVVITKVFCIVIAVAVFLSLVHWATGIFPWPVYTRAGGLAGLFSHKNMLGQRALFGIIAIMTIWLMRREEASRDLRLILIPTMLVMLLVLVLSQSMTAVLMTPVMLGMLFLLCLRRIPKAVTTPVGTLIFLMVGIGPLILALLNLNAITAVLDGVGKSSTLTGRTTLWEVARGVSAEHPVLGVGYGAFWKAPQFLNERLMTQEAGATTSRAFHNFALEILVGAGWPALLSMFALLAATFYRLFRLYALQGSAAAAGGIVMMVAIIIASLVGTSLFRGHEIMIMLTVMYLVSSQEDWRTWQNSSAS